MAPVHRSTSEQRVEQAGPGKMSWRKFKKMLEEKQRERDELKASEPRQERLSLLDRQRALLKIKALKPDPSKDGPDPHNLNPNQSQNNNQSVRMNREAEKGEKKPRTMKDMVQLHLDQSRAFGQAKRGADPSPRRSVSPVRAEQKTLQPRDNSKKRDTSPPKSNASPKRNTSPQRKTNASPDRKDKKTKKRDTSPNRNVSPKTKTNTSPQINKSQSPNPKTNKSPERKLKSKGKEADKDIPVIWFTKDPAGQSSGNPSTKAPVKQDPVPSKAQPPGGSNEKANKSPWWKRGGNKQQEKNTPVETNTSSEKPAVVDTKSSPRGRYISPVVDTNMPRQGYPHSPGKAPKPKGKSLNQKRKKFIRRIDKQKPRQSDWKNAEARKPKKKAVEGMDEHDQYAYEARHPVVVDRHDPYPYDHYHRPSRRIEATVPKRTRSKSPQKSKGPHHQKRSRSESPQKPSDQYRTDRRSRSQSPEKRYQRAPTMARAPRQTVTIERTIPKVVRVTDERGEQHVIVEKKERIELFKGKYPNYLRTGTQPDLKKWRKLRRPQMQASAPVSVSTSSNGFARSHPPAWFDRTAYRNDSYERTLQKRKLIKLGYPIDDEFMESHKDDEGEAHPEVRVHNPKTGVFYQATPEPLPQHPYNRGRVSALSYSDGSTPRGQKAPQHYREDMLPHDPNTEVVYNDGYEIYRDRYPNYLRHRQWKKSVPLLIQPPPQEPDSDDDRHQRHRREQQEPEEDYTPREQQREQPKQRPETYHQRQQQEADYDDDEGYQRSPSPPLPPLQRNAGNDNDSDSEVDGFRHRRELGSTSPQRDLYRNLNSRKSQPSPSHHDSGLGSGNKTPDTPSSPPPPHKLPTPPKHKASTPRLARGQSRQHTELLDDEVEPEEGSGEIPEVLQSLLGNGAFITEPRGTQTNRILSVQSDAEKFGRSPQELDHAVWPRYSIAVNEGVAAVVRCPKSHLEETKRCLIFEDSIPPSLHGKLPTLPFMEFEDWDGNVRMSPMRLYWEGGKGRPMQNAIYLALPIQGNNYNEILQQLIFLYTNDMLKWHQEEGRIISLKIEGEKHDFIEVYIPKPFRFLIFDVKVRYREDIKTISPNGGELESQMEQGIRVEVRSRTFDKPAKMKLKVEPLDMNETDIRQLVPSIHAVHAVAVSPIVKLATSEPMKQAVSIYVPKPGHSTFGSVKMGVQGKMPDLRNMRVHLLTKEKEVARFNASATLKRELAKELEFQVRIWKYGGRCYCLLVLEGVELLGPGASDYGVSTPPPSDAAAGFLSNVLMRQMAVEMTYDDVQLRLLGRHLLNSTTANAIIDQHPDNIEMAMFKILRRWNNQNRKTSDAIMVRRLITALRESNLKEEATIIRQKYDAHLTGSERNTIIAVLDELKACPSVLVNWKLLAKYLGLSPDEMNAQDLKVEAPSDIKRTCARMLKKVFEKLEGNTEYYRDILMKYIQALEQIGCHKIAGSIEKRHIDKFYISPV